MGPPRSAELTPPAGRVLRSRIAALLTAIAFTGAASVAIGGDAHARPAAPLRCPTTTEDVEAGRWWRTPMPSLEAPPAIVERSLYDYEWRVSVSEWEPRLIYASNVWHVYKSVDGGCTWKESFSVFRSSPAPGAEWSDRIVSIHAPARGAAAPAHLLVQRGGLLYLGVQQEGADDWSLEPLPAAGTGAVVSGAAPRLWVAPSDPRILYAQIDGALYRSLDGGGEWELRHAFVPEVPEFTYWVSDLSCPAGAGPCPLVDVGVMEVDPADPDVLWTATEDGVFRSGDGGASWRNVHRATYATLGPATEIDLFRGDDRERVAVFAEWKVAWSGEGGGMWQLRKPPSGTDSSGVHSPDYSGVDSVASAAAERMVAVMDSSRSYAGFNALVSRGSGWKVITPRSLACSGEVELRGNCLRGVGYVRSARSYYAIEADGSHLWAFQPRR